MVGHGGSSAGSYLTDPTSPIPSHCALIVATSTLRVKAILCSRFENIGNTCYMNSILQSVYCLEPFKADLERLEKLTISIPDTKKQLLK